ncbi:MAG: hypothetical protein ACREJQ_03490 [bacterium]
MGRKLDRLSNLAERWEKKYAIKMKGDPQLWSELKRIETTYGEWVIVGPNRHKGFWKSKAGRKAADGQVVAVSKVLKCTAVSDDNAVELACMLEDVPCIGWAEFARRLREKERRPEMPLPFGKS